MKSLNTYIQEKLIIRNAPKRTKEVKFASDMNAFSILIITENNHLPYKDAVLYLNPVHIDSFNGSTMELTSLYVYHDLYNRKRQYIRKNLVVDSNIIYFKSTSPTSYGVIEIFLHPEHKDTWDDVIELARQHRNKGNEYVDIDEIFEIIGIDNDAFKEYEHIDAKINELEDDLNKISEINYTNIINK